MQIATSNDTSPDEWQSPAAKQSERNFKVVCSSHDYYSLGCSLQSAITEITDEAQEDTHAGEWQRPAQKHFDHKENVYMVNQEEPAADLNVLELTRNVLTREDVRQARHEVAQIRMALGGMKKLRY